MFNSLQCKVKYVEYVGKSKRLLMHGRIDGRYKGRVGSGVPPILPLERAKGGHHPMSCFCNLSKAILSKPLVNKSPN
jgi:hypothetical protein